MSSSIPFQPEHIRDYLNGTFIELFLNGIYTLIISFAIFKIVSDRGWRQLFQPLHIAMVVVYSFSVLHFAYKWALLYDAFILHGESAETIVATFNRHRNSTLGRIWRPLTANVNLLLQDSVMLWRCWVLWDRNWQVILAPTLLVGWQSFFTLWIVVTQGLNKHPGTLDGASSTLANVSISLATTIFLTGLIIYRIACLGSIRRYHKIVEIVVESSGLYVIALIAYFPFLLSKTKTDIIAGAILEQIGGIALTMVVARVSVALPVSTDLDGNWTVPTSTCRFQPYSRDRRDSQAASTFELERTGPTEDQPNSYNLQPIWTKWSDGARPGLIEGKAEA